MCLLLKWYHWLFRDFEWTWYAHTYIYSYIHILIHAYTHTYICLYNNMILQTYIQTNIHTNKHTYIYIYIYIVKSPRRSFDDVWLRLNGFKNRSVDKEYEQDVCWKGFHERNWKCVWYVCLYMYIYIYSHTHIYLYVYIYIYIYI